MGFHMENLTLDQIVALVKVCDTAFDLRLVYKLTSRLDNTCHGALVLLRCFSSQSLYCAAVPTVQ